MIPEIFRRLSGVNWAVKSSNDRSPVEQSDAGIHTRGS